MTVEKLIEKLELEAVGGQKGITKEVKGAYIGDLLSWVMAHIGSGDAWITIQTNINVIAVAALGEASCIIVAEDAEIEESTKIKADEEGIPLLRSSLSAYELAIQIYQCLEGLEKK
ncbi:AraC family transcriptional regulator [Clostridium formicaceticum]|uniref:AraC family transcriptional regulator n=1 Tax=Clostridium formicaceticum TaxID=1497 RepID=A0ABM6EZ88_9CLOT|nr:AraC family transcriptional regulator [Clostridium formicaceticum]